MKRWLSTSVMLGVAWVTTPVALSQAQQRDQSVQNWPAPQEGNFIAHNFHFQSGETLPEVRIHYRTLGKPVRDANGHTTNAVLILHGTGGDGTTFLRPIFAGVLFSPGQLLDATKYFLILPDNVGHGKSSKPSDGLHAHFPRYDYADMVALQHELVTEGLEVDHLRLILGTSMGCMHSWVWGETYVNFADALMPLACQTVPGLPGEIAGEHHEHKGGEHDGKVRDDEADDQEHGTYDLYGQRHQDEP